MIDFKFLERVLDLLNKSDAHTIEIKKQLWSTSIRVSKGGFGNESGPVTYQVASAPANAPAPAVASDAAPVAPAESAAPAPSEFAEIKSPMVGTFYTQPEPGAEPYVKVGGRLSPGQTVCIIEAMKIMNPIDAEIGGVVKERVVEDGQPVEFGQVLFRVDTNG